jgi:hypothetical protein
LIFTLFAGFKQAQSESFPGKTKKQEALKKGDFYEKIVSFDICSVRHPDDVRHAESTRNSC